MVNKVVSNQTSSDFSSIDAIMINSIDEETILNPYIKPEIIRTDFHEVPGSGRHNLSGREWTFGCISTPLFYQSSFYHRYELQNSGSVHVCCNIHGLGILFERLRY